MRRIAVAERIAAILLGVLITALGIVVTIHSPVYSMMVLKGPLFGPVTILIGLLFLCAAVFRWATFSERPSNLKGKANRRQ